MSYCEKIWKVIVGIVSETISDDSGCVNRCVHTLLLLVDQLAAAHRENLGKTVKPLKMSTMAIMPHRALPGPVLFSVTVRSFCILFTFIYNDRAGLMIEISFYFARLAAWSETIIWWDSKRKCIY